MKTHGDPSIWIGEDVGFRVAPDKSMTHVEIDAPSIYLGSAGSLIFYGNESEQRDLLMRLRDTVSGYLNESADALMTARASEAGA